MSEAQLNKTQEHLAPQPQPEQTGIRVGRSWRAGIAVPVVVAAGAILAGCGSDDDSGLRDHFDGTESIPAANPSSEDQADGQPVGAGAGVLDGSDAQIRAEALNGDTNCGGELMQGEWNVNAMLDILTAPENDDLRVEMLELAKRKFGGENVIKTLLEGRYVTSGLKEEYIHSEDNKIDDLYVLMVGASTSQQMTDEAVAKFGSRENYMCIVKDGGGIGDEVELRDIRSNSNDGVNVKLGAMTVTPEAWGAALAQAEANGTDLSANVIHWEAEDTITTHDGETVKRKVIRVVFFDDDCFNPEYATDIVHVPEQPETPIETVVPTSPTHAPTTSIAGPTTTHEIPERTTTTTSQPERTTTTTQVVVEKEDDGELPDTGTDADQDQGTPDDPGQGPAGQEPDDSGFIPSETPPSSQAPDPAPAPAPAPDTAPPATEGTAPEETNPPVIAENNPTPTNPESAPTPDPDSLGFGDAAWAIAGLAGLMYVGNRARKEPTPVPVNVKKTSK